MIEQAPLVTFLSTYLYLLFFITGMMFYENPLVSLLLYYRLKWKLYKPIETRINDFVYENELFYRRLFK